jgi:CheY-like chemotaxis protein
MPPHKQNESSDAPPRGVRVLIVEDEPSAREASMRFLDRCGCEVATAGEANEAIEQAEQLQPDVVVCDWQLGGSKTGVDVARELQQRYNVHIIFVTAYPLDELRNASNGIRVHRYLRKPISLNSLAETIASIPSW